MLDKLLLNMSSSENKDFIIISSSVTFCTVAGRSSLHPV